MISILLIFSKLQMDNKYGAHVSSFVCVRFKCQSTVVLLIFLTFKPIQSMQACVSMPSHWVEGELLSFEAATF